MSIISAAILAIALILITIMCGAILGGRSIGECTRRGLIMPGLGFTVLLLINLPFMIAEWLF